MIKKYRKYLLCILSLVTDSLSASEQLRGISIFSPRAQNVNAARDIAGWHPYIHRYDAHDNYTAFSITPSYNQSLRPQRMALVMWNNDTYTVTGSQVLGRENTQELLADYFGLSPAYSGNEFFKPLIKNLLIDGALYVGFDKLVPKLYTQFRTPLVWTQWDLKLAENILTTGEGTLYPAGYMAPTAVTPPYETYTQAMRGNQSFGEVEKLKYGKIDGAQAKSGVATLEWILGYDFISRERSHFGLNFRVSAPTGSRTKGEYFFEPRVGNGKLWQVGIGFTGHTRVWEKDDNQELGFFVDVNMTHLCNGTQHRSFDFCKNGFYSRYILLKEFDEDGMFAEKILPAINVTTLKCHVANDIQVDAVLMFGYTYNDFVFDIGYNGWIRSREKVSIHECIPHNRYGIKGVAYAASPITGKPLNITESNATIFETHNIVFDDPSPVFISTADLDPESAASPLLLTHKFFVHFAHTFLNTDKYPVSPFIGMGAEIEFEGINSRNATQPDRTTMGQASVWLKGGISY
jgi:hypothetical protein